MLIFKLLTCQEVANLASDYLDKQTDGKLSLKIRVHLMMCANCRRFVKHLHLTSTAVPHLIRKDVAPTDAEAILKKIKERS
jgi:predicted anti-sigma-YlaC factor YlaD